MQIICTKSVLFSISQHTVPKFSWVGKRERDGRPPEMCILGNPYWSTWLPCFKSDEEAARSAQPAHTI